MNSFLTNTGEEIGREKQNTGSQEKNAIQFKPYQTIFFPCDIIIHVTNIQFRITEIKVVERCIN